MTIESALATLRPGARWTLRGSSYSGLEWLDVEQAKPTEAEVDAAMLLPESSVVPAEVPTWALREVCMIRGHTAAIESALANLSEPQRTIANNRWSHKPTISRVSSLISAMQALLGWTSDYVDELFLEAGTK
jgi:hypothetical protein